MLLLFGEAIKTKKLAEDQFHCPCCQQDAHYIHWQMRSYFSLFFLPVLPLNVTAEYIECQQCHGTFDAHATEKPAFAKHQELLPQLLAVLLREEGINAEAKAHYYALVQHYCQRDLNDNTLYQLLQQLPVGGIFEMLKKQRKYLNPYSKIKLLQGSYQFLNELRPMNQNDQISLNLIGNAIDIDIQTIRELIRSWQQP